MRFLPLSRDNLLSRTHFSFPLGNLFFCFLLPLLKVVLTEIKKFNGNTRAFVPVIAAAVIIGFVLSPKQDSFVAFNSKARPIVVTNRTIKATTRRTRLDGAVNQSFVRFNNLGSRAWI